MASPDYVGDLEHDLDMIRMSSTSARRAAGNWMRGQCKARDARRSVDDTLVELRRICIEVEKANRLDVSIVVWEVILATMHLHDALSSEDKPGVYTAAQLLVRREAAVSRAVECMQPARIPAGDFVSEIS